jgi:hypothetical protein
LQMPLVKNVWIGCASPSNSPSHTIVTRSEFRIPHCQTAHSAAPSDNP